MVTSAPPPVVRGDAHVHVDIRIDFFGIPLAGAQDVVFVLDHSGSMSGVSAGFAGQDVGMSEGGAILTGLAATVINARWGMLVTCSWRVASWATSAPRRPRAQCTPPCPASTCGRLSQTG